MHIKTLKVRSNKKIKNKAETFFVNNKLFTALLIIFLLGTILGNLVFKNASESFFKKISDLITCNFEVRSSGSFFNIFSESIFSSFIFILVIFSIGVSAFGLTLVPLIIFFKGYCTGLFQSYLWSSFGLKGLIFFILVILPGLFVSILAILLMAKEAIKMSNIFSNMLLNIKTWQSDEKYVKSYLTKTGCIVILVLMSAFIDALTNFLLFRFFSFYFIFI